MKSTKIIFWTSTILIVLFEGLVPALTFNTEIARQGVSHLGYPDYFRVWFTVFKVIGAILLILPRLPRRVKDWAYAGFTFDFIFASISHGMVDGIADGQTWFPLVVLAILMVSYVCYNRLLTGSRISAGSARVPGLSM
ncbi:DoxX family protein [Puia sp. P3]|uniref:DoxX family protein n=1 Tax=Puia sp. P3 TaxID=3423952 RepID=UPI003D6784ED